MMKSGDIITIKGHQVVLQKLLGKGKSGYSWLADMDSNKVVLKALHDEPNPYYEFDTSKMQHELDAYYALRQISVSIPALMEIDPEQDLLLKAYIPGTVAGEAIAENQVSESIFAQLAGMFHAARENNFNLDYFPMNFVITPEERLVYIDYEINPFSKEWDLWNWGIYYWLNSSGMKQFLETGDPAYINVRADSGIPIKSGMEESTREIMHKYGKVK